MASVSMSMPFTVVAAKRQLNQPMAGTSFQPLKLKELNQKVVGSKARLVRAQASLKERVVAGATAAGIAASMVVPDVALAVDGMTPSLKNFLLSIVSGGVVFAVIGGVVIGVSSFDPVKRT